MVIKPKSMANSISKTTGIGKDPTTSTAFLPDKERELQEQQLREQLKQEYELRQQVCMNIPEAQWVSLGSVYVLCYIAISQCSMPSISKQQLCIVIRQSLRC